MAANEVHNHCDDLSGSENQSGDGPFAAEVYYTGPYTVKRGRHPALKGDPTRKSEPYSFAQESAESSRQHLVRRSDLQTLILKLRTCANSGL